MLLSCFCIGAAGVFGSGDVTPFVESLPPDFYLTTLSKSKEILLNYLEGTSGFADPTPEIVIKRVFAEEMLDLVDSKTELRETFLQTPEGKWYKAITFLVGVTFVGLYVGIRLASSNSR